MIKVYFKCDKCGNKHYLTVGVKDSKIEGVHDVSNNPEHNDIINKFIVPEIDENDEIISLDGTENCIKEKKKLYS